MTTFLPCMGYILIGIITFSGFINCFNNLNFPPLLFYLMDFFWKIIFNNFGNFKLFATLLFFNIVRS